MISQFRKFDSRTASPSRMLRICMMSGAELAAVPVEEVISVREVKRLLHQQHGLPPRFRQRLVLNGASLDDADELASPQDLELVVLPFCNASVQQVYEFRAAAGDGLVQQAGAYSISGE